MPKLSPVRDIPEGAVSFSACVQLADAPRLVAWRCDACGTAYFERRNGCGRCGGHTFTVGPAATEGEVEAFTVVHRSSPGVEVPYTSVVVRLDDGAWIRGNLIDHVRDDLEGLVGRRVAVRFVEGARTDDGAVGIAYAFVQMADER